MDESDTEQSRWRLSRYAPPDHGEVNPLVIEIERLRAELAAAQATIKQYDDYIEELDRIAESDE